MIFLVKKVILEILDDSLISAEPSDILSIHEKTQTNKQKQTHKKKIKAKADRGILMYAVALEIRALI